MGTQEMFCLKTVDMPLEYLALKVQKANVQISANGQLLLILHQDRQQNGKCHSVINRTRMITSQRVAAHPSGVPSLKRPILTIWLQMETSIRRVKDIWFPLYVNLKSLCHHHLFWSISYEFLQLLNLYYLSYSLKYGIAFHSLILFVLL